MREQSQAKIISCNSDSEAVCASAARISTTQGDANEIFEKSKGNEKNQGLIKRVLQSGHRSLIEHAVFTIALRNVSAYVEQFFIECRLASFTVKSRRYVDFSGLGYHIPPELRGDALSAYCRYMDMLFGAYQELLENGVAKEDARFLLPYSFNSNFYCTLNARELARVLRTIRFGRGRDIPELRSLADQIVSQLETMFPCLLAELAGRPEEEPAPSAGRARREPVFISAREAGAVRVLNAPAEPLRMLEAAYHVQHPELERPFAIAALLSSERPRELEQLSYSFLISDVTLSGVTHIVRHRMQSVIVPPIQSVDHGKYIVPASIEREPKLLERYKRSLENANAMVREALQDPTLRKYSYYYALSGNMMDLMTTLNARELKHLIQLRSCNRAQWEVRKIAVEMLKRLREHFPELFGLLGPSCYTNGSCPEGGMTCGKMEEVISEFGGSL